MNKDKVWSRVEVFEVSKKVEDLLLNRKIY